MIVKFIPETNEEKAKSPAIKEYRGVKEFFVFGNRKDDDGDKIDFHEWNGSYRYLLSNLAYFENIINDERRNSDPLTAKMGSKMMKKGTIPMKDVETLDPQELYVDKEIIENSNVEPDNDPLPKSNLTILPKEDC